MTQENVHALLLGIKNLERHIETIRNFGIEPIVAVNRFVSDTEAEICTLMEWAKKNDIRIARTNVWAEGGKGGLDLAKQVLEVLDQPKMHRYMM